MLLGSTTRRLAALLIIGTFVFAAFSGVPHLSIDSGVDGQMGGQMGPCPLMPGVVICNMTPLQHIAAAQAMLTALPQSSDVLVLLLLLLASIIATTILSNIRRARPRAAPMPIYARREYAPSSPLLESFSNGIVHSKAF